MIFALELKIPGLNWYSVIFPLPALILDKIILTALTSHADPCEYWAHHACPSHEVREECKERMRDEP